MITNIFPVEITAVFYYNCSMEKITLPDNVKMIIDTLREGGFTAHAVGGCVRDTLLGRVPEDWDITTNALPAEIKSCFRHTVDTGIMHGTVTVLLYPDSDDRHRSEKTTPMTYEVTTYRIDGSYSDRRHPDKVTFTEKLSEDLRRRDFTINAMACNNETGIVDLFCGQEDLKNRVIRCVGDPDERFDEDALRILRAVRFSAQLGFSIEEKTAEAIRRHTEFLDAVSKERIYAELNKLICSAHPEKLASLFDLGIIRHITPGFEKIRTFPAELFLPEIPLESRYRRYALLFRGMKKERVKTILDGLKADCRTRDLSALLGSELFTVLPADRYELKKYIARMTFSQFEDLLSLKELIRGTDEYKNQCAEEDLSAVRALFTEIVKNNEPVYMKDLVVTGSDLLKAGIPEGPAVGKMLSRMLDDIRRDPMNNSVLFLFAKHFSKIQ